MPRTIAQARKQIRKDVRAARNSLSHHEQQQAAQALVKRIQHNPTCVNAKVVALYLSNDGELNTQPLIHWCWQQQKKVVLPVIHPFNQGQLLFLNYTPSTQLITNQYQILEPKLSVLHVVPIDYIDVIFTPLVAFDQQGQRLGMGGGYYDRTLAQWHRKKVTHANPYPIGLAHDCQQVNLIPIQPWDIPLPCIYTPTKSIKTHND